MSILNVMQEQVFKVTETEISPVTQFSSWVWSGSRYSGLLCMALSSTLYLIMELLSNTFSGQYFLALYGLVLSCDFHHCAQFHGFVFKMIIAFSEDQKMVTCFQMLKLFGVMLCSLSFFHMVVESLYIGCLVSETVDLFKKPFVFSSWNGFLLRLSASLLLFIRVFL